MFVCVCLCGAKCRKTTRTGCSEEWKFNNAVEQTACNSCSNFALAILLIALVYGVLLYVCVCVFGDEFAFIHIVSLCAAYTNLAIILFVVYTQYSTTGQIDFERNRMKRYIQRIGANATNSIGLLGFQSRAICALVWGICYVVFDLIISWIFIESTWWCVPYALFRTSGQLVWV